MKIFLSILLLWQLTIFEASAEIIDIQKEEKLFGDWKTFCEIDAMMDTAHCKIAAKFFENTAVVTIEPTAKFSNQLLIVIPQVKLGTFVKIRIDQNNLILSNNVSNRDFGLVSLTEEQKITIFNQMKNGDFLFLRFNIRDSDKEITAKINLKDFRNALNYYNSRTNQTSK